MDDRTALELFGAHQRARGLAPGTLACYKSVHTIFGGWLAERGLTLHTASKHDVLAWLAERPDLCNRSRSLYIVRLHALYVWLQEEGFRADIPTARLPRPKMPQSLPRPYSTSNLRRALAAADARTALFLVFASYGGLRRAEIARLHREDLMLDHTPPVMLVTGKGNRQRLVPISPIIRRHLDSYGLPVSGPLFPGRYAGHLAPHTVGRTVADHLRKCGVDATGHCGRHYFASELYRASGGDLLLTQQMLGHSSPNTTAIYAAWSPDKAAAAIDLLPADREPDEDESA